MNPNYLQHTSSSACSPVKCRCGRQLDVVRTVCRCGAEMIVTNVFNEEVRHFNCPNCGEKMEVKFKLFDTPQPVHFPPADLSAEKTDSNKKPGEEINPDSSDAQSAEPKKRPTPPPPPKPKPVTPAQPIQPVRMLSPFALKFNDSTFNLFMGENTVGKKSITIQVDVPLPIIDNYTSRKHCKIIVTLDKKNQPQAEIFNWENKNPTYVNRRRVKNSVTLKPGDTIQMGQAEVVFTNAI